MSPGSQMKQELEPDLMASKKVSRRVFVGAALVGTGAAAGALLRRSQESAVPPAGSATIDASEFAYDVSEFARTDPKLLLYQPAGTFPTGMERVKRLTVDSTGRIWVAGDRMVGQFSPTGEAGRQLKLERPPHALWAGRDGELVVALGNFFEVYDGQGRLRLRSPRLGEDSFLTAVAVEGATIYLADAGRREVLQCDRGTGEITGRFGRKDQPAGNPGFVVPSPYFDLAVSRGRLHVTNPGRLRVETYTLDGRFESSWGSPGLAPNRFCGCCNPVYFTLRPNGGFLTSEKGLTRIGVYGADGSFEGLVAGPDTLVDDKELAKRACQDCRLGGGFDVACDAAGRVFVLDPFRKSVRVFVPRSA